MDAFSVARYGMMAASRRFESAASRVVDPMIGGLDAEAMVEMTLAKTQFKAQIGVLRIADEMQSALLNLQSARD